MREITLDIEELHQIIGVGNFEDTGYTGSNTYNLAFRIVDSDWLAAHDAEVARKTLEDAADAYKSGQLTGMFMGRDDCARELSPRSCRFYLYRQGRRGRMRDVCMACGRSIFTIHPRGMGITLAQQWTHGGYGFVDRQHIPIPKNHDFKVVNR